MPAAVPKLVPSMRTVAPGTPRPLPCSVTRPVMVPETWARGAAAHSSSAQSAARGEKRIGRAVEGENGTGANGSMGAGRGVRPS